MFRWPHTAMLIRAHVAPGVVAAHCTPRLCPRQKLSTVRWSCFHRTGRARSCDSGRRVVMQQARPPECSCNRAVELSSCSPCASLNEECTLDAACPSPSPPNLPLCLPARVRSTRQGGFHGEPSAPLAIHARAPLRGKHDRDSAIRDSSSHGTCRELLPECPWKCPWNAERSTVLFVPSVAAGALQGHSTSGFLSGFLSDVCRAGRHGKRPCRAQTALRRSRRHHRRRQAQDSGGTCPREISFFHRFCPREILKHAHGHLQRVHGGNVWHSVTASAAAP